MLEIPLDRELYPEFGAIGELGGSIEAGGYSAQANDQPIGVQLRRIVESLDPHATGWFTEPDSPVIQVYRRFDLWLIPHSVSIIRREGWSEPTAVGIQIRYKNDNRTCSVRGLIPSARFVEYGKVSGSINLNGELSQKADVVGLDRAEPGLEPCAGLKVSLRAGAQVSVNFTANVATPYISAVGENSSGCEWRFDRHDRPLMGTDLKTWAVVALPKSRLATQRSLNYDIKFYIDARTLIVTRHYESDWTSVKCELD